MRTILFKLVQFKTFYLPVKKTGWPLAENVNKTPAFPVDIKISFASTYHILINSIFCVCSFGDTTEMFRPVMVEPSPEYLEATWK